MSSPAPPLDLARVRQWWAKSRWYRKASRPWNRALLEVELARREAFARGAVHGDWLTMLREGRLEIGPQAFFEPGVWLTGGPDARIVIGGGTFLNLGVMVAAEQLVEIGEHCMAANGCLITDANHRFDDPTKPVPWQGFASKGPTTIGDNVWLGANVVVTSGVAIGSRCVIGANSVVTTDIPPFSIAAGAPARVLKQMPYAVGDA
ncbi:acyltransferase [Patulibacter brassicae]|uniref:Acyltransferase n=1 Tax=Patulibacter brassicae TaxID=1705717 RepID=A0ABU4VHE0_9ACTN|nr:acyltransferase [Patulibacter brassicae]MDX8150559.1 acyltransferase [Patulibacter brassicae]